MNNNIFISLFRSCSDFKFYIEVFFQATKKTLLYLAFLVFLVTVILAIRYSIILNDFSRKGVQWIIENIPYIEINDGIVTADVAQPYVVTEKDFVAIIDTTGETTEIDPTVKAGILLTKDKLIVKTSDIRTQEVNLSKIKEFKFAKKSLHRWRKILIICLIPLMTIMQFVCLAIAKLIQAIIAGLIIIIFKPQLRFNNTFNICSYALTPATLLATLVTAITYKPLPFFFVVYLGMYIAFILGALRQCPLEQETAK